MKLEVLEKTLSKLADLIEQNRFESLETDTLEIKPVPPDGASWKERYKSACAFLNTRGGIIILGVKEEGTGPQARYRFTGWQPHAEPNLKEFAKRFTDHRLTPLDLSEAFPPPMIRDFLNGQVGILLVDELPADRKFVFYEGVGYRRIGTGDNKIPPDEIERQEEFRIEAINARELQLIEGAKSTDLDLDKINEYITQLNRPVRVETIKPDFQMALPFLERKCFLKEGGVTILGMLVCGKHPADSLGFRCQLHGYVEAPGEIARDKQDISDNVLGLMERGLEYLHRNIQIGVSPEQGGVNRPQYPEQLLRETVNNALAHRDYSINRHAILAVRPDEYVSIANPGTFRQQLLIEDTSSSVPLLRILPEAKPRNPKLADVLRVFRKWEGRGIGMSTLAALALENKIDLPYYRLRTDEVTLYLPSGRLLDDRMERHFKAFDRHIGDKMRGMTLTEAQALVLAYLVKSEWANERRLYTILLTPDNNHYSELAALARAGLIHEHPGSKPNYPVFQVDRELMRRDYIDELRTLFGLGFDNLDNSLKDALGVVYRFNKFSKQTSVTAKEVSFYLWYDSGGKNDIRAFESFDRKTRRAFNKLELGGFVTRQEGSRGWLLNRTSEQRFLKSGETSGGGDETV